jgi:hypothetical protein
VEVVQREESDYGVERTVERLRQLQDVGAVQRDLVAAGVERLQAAEECRGEIDALDREPALGQRQRVAAHAAPDVENVLARREPGEPDQRVYLPLNIRRGRRPHRLLAGMLEVRDLGPVVRGDVRRRRAGHA